MDAKSLSREEHVERVDLWKKVERFMAGCSATEMPRQGVRPCGLAPGAEKTTVAIMSDRLVSVNAYETVIFAMSVPLLTKLSQYDTMLMLLNLEKVV